MANIGVDTAEMGCTASISHPNQDAGSLWTFFPQHAYGVDMYYVGMELFDAGGSSVYLCFSEDYLRDLNPSSFFLAVTSDPGKASLFRMSSTSRQEICLMTLTVDYGPLWINHSGPELSSHAPGTLLYGH